jgi:hypothetical protein
VIRFQITQFKNNGLREAVVRCNFVLFVFEHFFYSSAIPIVVVMLMAVNRNFIIVYILWITLEGGLYPTKSHFFICAMPYVQARVF